MEEVLSNQQARPGDATQLMHVIFSVSYTHLRAHETDSYLVCRLLLEKKKTTVAVSYTLLRAHETRASIVIPLRLEKNAA